MNDNKLKAAIAENPLLVLLLGACPAMGASGGVLPALGMGGAVVIVLLLSGLIIAALWRAVPEKGRIASFTLVIAGVASVVQLLMNAFLPNIYQMLGVYLAVIAVDLLVFSSAEKAAGHGAGAVLRNSLLTGLGFAALLLIMGAVRELFGAGSFAGMDVPFLKDYNIPTLTQASGGFFVLAITAAAVSKLRPQAGNEPEGAAAAAAGLDDGNGRADI